MIETPEARLRRVVAEIERLQVEASKLARELASIQRERLGDPHLPVAGDPAAIERLVNEVAGPENIRHRRPKA